jgi:GNAT superfamily N-acetyltransferase
MYERTPPDGSTATEPQAWPDDLERLEEAYLAVWVAVLATDGTERVIGMVGVTPAGAEIPTSVLRDRTDVVQLRRMRVVPECQRRGIGRQLTEAVIAWATAQGAPALILETTAQQRAARALYQRMGFREVARSMLGPYELVWFKLDFVDAR